MAAAVIVINAILINLWSHSINYSQFSNLDYGKVKNVAEQENFFIYIVLIISI